MRVHRFAVATAIATFCLLIAGGLVSATESGLACPDWPLCEGKFFPQMVGGKQFEHTHRLVASLVAVMTFILCGLLFKTRRTDRLLRRLGAGAVVLVVIQALLGALTVKLALPAWVSSLHQATAMAFFALIVCLAFLTRQRTPDFSGRVLDPEPARRVGKLTVAVSLLAYAQLVVGAVMRHTRGGLACGFDFPLCLGKLWPLDGGFAQQVHLVHRAGGFLVGLAVWALAIYVLQRAGQHKLLRALAMLAAGTVVIQVALGVATVLASRELLTMTVHTTLGPALLANLVALYWVACPSSLPGRPSQPVKAAVAPSLEAA
jgi:heme A synthase